MCLLDDWIVDCVELVGGLFFFFNGVGVVGGLLDYISKFVDCYGDFMEGWVCYGSYDDLEVVFGFNQVLGIGFELKYFVCLDVSCSGGNGYVDCNLCELWNVVFFLFSDLILDFFYILVLEYQDEQEDSFYWGMLVFNFYVGELKIDKSCCCENYNVVDGCYEQCVCWLCLIFEYWVSDSMCWCNIFYYYDVECDYCNFEIYCYNVDNSGVVCFNVFFQCYDQQFNGNCFELQYSQLLFGLVSDWVLGFDYSINKQMCFLSIVFGLFGMVDLVSFELGYFYDLLGMCFGYWKDCSNEVCISVLFVENCLGLIDELLLVIGLCYDYFDFDVCNYWMVIVSDFVYFEWCWDVVIGCVGLVYQFILYVNVYL